MEEAIFHEAIFQEFRRLAKDASWESYQLLTDPSFEAKVIHTANPEFIADYFHQVESPERIADHFGRDSLGYLTYQMRYG